MSHTTGTVPDTGRRRRQRRVTAIQALAATLLVAAAAIVLARGASGEPASASAKHQPLSTAQQQAGMDSGQPFADPPVLDAADMTINLTAKDTSFEIAGKPAYGRSYDGSFMAPTLHLEPGEHATITLVNKLSVATNLHFHGLHVSPSGDSDNAFLCVAPGETFQYHLDLPANHPVGTYWYHSHAMGKTCPSGDSAMAGMDMSGSHDMSSDGFVPGDVENQIFSGLSGAMVVGDDRDLLPADLKHITAHTVNLKDVQLDSTGHIIQNTDTTEIDPGAPTVRLVNGQLMPVLTMKPNETQLWRLANVGADVWYHLKLDGYQFTVIGQDGVSASTVTTEDTLLLPPGKRYDVLVTAGSKAGETTLRTLAFGNGPDGDSFPETPLFNVNIDGGAQAKTPPVSGALPGSPADLSGATLAEHRTVTLSGDDEQGFFINGKQFDMNSSTFSTPAKLNTVEEWTITNETGEDHPFHIHTNFFQVMSINGETQPYVGRQDTIPVPHAVDGVPGKVVIRIPFDDFAGKEMFHCHIANHEDNGMMSYIDVVK